MTTTSTSGGKWLILTITIFSISAIIQVRPAAGVEIPNEEPKPTDSTYPGLDENSHEQRPRDSDRDLLPVHLGDLNSQLDGTTSTNSTAFNPSNCSVSQDMERSILGRNHPLLITAIVGLILMLLWSEYRHAETKKALLPLKKKVVDLSRNLWKVSTASENQQYDLDACENARDEKQVKIEQLESELSLMKQANADNQDYIKRLKRVLLHTAQMKVELEDVLAKTTKERDETGIKNMLLHDRYNNLMEKFKPIHREWQRTKGIKISTAEPLVTSEEASTDSAQSQQQTRPSSVKSRIQKSAPTTTTEEPTAAKEESSESESSDPNEFPLVSSEIGQPATSPPKKKGFFKTFGRICRCVRKKKSGSKEDSSKVKVKRSARSDTKECADLRPP